MVGSCPITCTLELFGHALGRLLQGDVNDRWAWFAGPDALDQECVTVRTRNRRRLYRQVWAIEAGNDRAFSRNAESGANLIDNRRNCRGGQRQDPFGLEVPSGFGQLQVVGTEIVSPFRDAMGFVDCEQRDLHASHRFQEAFVVEAFRRYVKKFQVSRLQSRLCFPVLVSRQR